MWAHLKGKDCRYFTQPKVCFHIAEIGEIFYQFTSVQRCELVNVISLAFSKYKGL